MKKIILLILLFVTLSSFAHGSSHVDQDDSGNASIKPCMILVSKTGQYVNANNMSFVSPTKISVSSRIEVSGVEFTFGKSYLDVATDDPKGYIQKFVEEVERKCK